MRTIWKGLWMGCAMAVLAAATASGQASLGAGDFVGEVKAGGNAYSLVRDAFVPTMWYYFPSAPRLTRNASGKPEFTLLRHQRTDGKKKIEQGFLQFACTFSPGEEALEEMRRELEKKTGESNLTVVAMPLIEANAVIYDLGGDLVSYNSSDKGVAATVSTAKMAFAMRMSRDGTDVYDALTVEGQTGVPVVLNYTYKALTAPAGFKVTFDWEKIHKHLSTDTQLQLDIAANLVKIPVQIGVSADARYSSVREKLTGDGSLVIEEIRSDDPNVSKKIDDVMDMIMTKIGQQMLVLMAPPDKIDPAKIPDPAKKSQNLLDQIQSLASPQMPSVVSVKAKVSTAVKDVKTVIQTKQTYDMRVRQYVKRSSQASGFIGIGHLSADDREGLVSFVNTRKWANLKFSLPYISDDPDLGIEEVTLTLRVKVPSKRNVALPDQQVFTWTKKDKEWTSGRETRTEAVFAMAELVDAYGRAAIFCEVKTNITYEPAGTGKTMSVNHTYEMPFFSGGIPVMQPFDSINKVVIDLTYLTFFSGAKSDDPLPISATVDLDTKRRPAVKADPDQGILAADAMPSTRLSATIKLERGQEYLEAPTIFLYPKAPGDDEPPVVSGTIKFKMTHRAPDKVITFNEAVADWIFITDWDLPMDDEE